MMTFDQMCKKMGKKRAIQEAVNCRRNGPTAAEKTRGIRGRVRYRFCSHGVWVIDDYKPRRCSECEGISRETKTKDFTPYFNIGLGCYVTSRSEEKRVARSLGLVEAG